MLSGNVTVTSAAVAGVGSLTLTNDSGDNDINVYRLDATHVEIDAFGGTTINGADSAVFALSNVTGITVNLGSGFDAYNIGSNPGDPALNIGSGGILFKGASGGGAGVDLQVYNASSNAMTIRGSVTFQGPKPGSAYTETSSDHSYFYVYTDSGSGHLTIGGSISARETETSSGYFSNHVSTSDGNLNVNGSVSLAMSGGKGFDNDIFTWGSGSISIGLDVTESMTGSDGGGYNLLHAYSGSGNITVGLCVTQTLSGTGMDYYNGVISSDTGGTGSVKIGGSLRQTASTDHYAENQVFASGSGSTAIGAGIVGGCVTQTMTTTGDGYGLNRIVTKGDGSVTIGNKLRGVLGGSVVQFNTSAEFVKNYIATYTGTGGITVAGSVTQNSASSASAVNMENDIIAGDGGGIGKITIRGSVTINDTGTYDHDNEIEALAGPSSLTIAGSVVVTDAATGSGKQSLQIQGNVYFGGGLTVVMNGTDALININNGSGFGTVQVKGLFVARMLG
ncbi:MAG: hypothetical protein JSS02_13015, partial [Planctomycetes bacterium]|nr:hypothetical protein [Planctomycetota bacterium]